MLNKKLLGATASAPALYPEDVFSTWLYTGNGSTQTITNGIDLAGKGGMVWLKCRSSALVAGHKVTDTARGTGNALTTNSTAGNLADSTLLTAFNSNGFSIGTYGGTNNNGDTFASWTFRKAPKFFDVVTFTSSGSGAVFNHSLGSTPGMIIIKRTDSTSAWLVWHRSLAAQNYLTLQTTNSSLDLGAVWCTPTSSNVTLENVFSGSGQQWVAYLFAHDAGGFGAAGTDNIISCGSFTGGSTLDVNLGYEPQFVMLKAASGASEWAIFDTMRGMSLTSYRVLYANLTQGEDAGGTTIFPTATGFTVNPANLFGNQTYIYMAIRRPMKTPTTGTGVFSPNTLTPSGATTVTTGFPVDLLITANRDKSITSTYSIDRLRGDTTNNFVSLVTNTTGAEGNATGYGVGLDNNTAIIDNFWNTAGGVTSSCIYWNFRRAPGFFDVVCYTGTGSARTVTHNLGVAPEMMIVKRRNAAAGWIVYAAPLGNTKYISFDTNEAQTASTVWNNTTPTSSVFTLGTANAVNSSGNTFVAYLFATLAGVSKVGSYTGNGSSQTINCGFSTGARFVLIKRTEAGSFGNWYVFDTARGIVSGNDPFLFLDSTQAEVTSRDAVDPANSGFIVNNDSTNFPINDTGGEYIFLAIA